MWKVSVKVLEEGRKDRGASKLASYFGQVGALGISRGRFFPTSIGGARPITPRGADSYNGADAPRPGCGCSAAAVNFPLRAQTWLQSQCGNCATAAATVGIGGRVPAYAGWVGGRTVTLCESIRYVGNSDGRVLGITLQLVAGD